MELRENKEEEDDDEVLLVKEGHKNQSNDVREFHKIRKKFFKGFFVIVYLKSEECRDHFTEEYRVVAGMLNVVITHGIHK
ncbi:hypothetical protein MKW98_001629 [Papaver atlanticum]|uniref:Uncharacterized protein n=1 Tax=Papaver atlanticum TaxID=357466 RepID=A0AAD4XAX2_9MAGN|nr:hypothetical protein MKW98_001629 [Papaver atlanticum]